MLSKRIKRWSLIVFLLIAAFLSVGLVYLSWAMKQPLYVFGSVNEGSALRGPLNPPKQTKGDVWRVEKEIELRFEAHGEGTPVVVVHGGPGVPYASPWTGLEPLRDRYRFYYYDQRGCGKSTRPFKQFDERKYYDNMIQLEKTLGLGAQIADLERIRRILGRDKLTLIGHSFGGLIAMLYAAEFPERVEKLVSAAIRPSLFPHRDGPRMQTLPRLRFANLEP